MVEATYLMVARKKKHGEKCVLAEETTISGISAMGLLMIMELRKLHFFVALLNGNMKGFSLYRVVFQEWIIIISTYSK